MYSFTINEEHFLQVANEKADLENIEDDDREKFINSLRLSESERYYFRDLNSEPYSYDFKITSQHYLSSKELFIQSIEIIMKKLKNLQTNLVNYLKNKDTTILIKRHKESQSIFDIIVTEEDDTLGNILQSYIVNNLINEDSVVNLCGYKRSHPLEDFIVFTISINPNNDVFQKTDDQKLIEIIKLIESAINSLYDILTKLADIANKSL